MDHRWGQRVEVDLGVQLLCHPRTIAVGRLMNVSVSGAYVQAGFIPALLAPVRILGFLSEHDGARRAGIEGYVVRRGTGGFAIEWFELAPAGVCRFLVACTPVSAPLGDRSVALPAYRQEVIPLRSRV